MEAETQSRSCADLRLWTLLGETLTVAVLAKEKALLGNKKAKKLNNKQSEVMNGLDDMMRMM